MGQGYILSCFSFFFRLVSTLRMQFLKTQPAYSISYKPTLAFEQMLLVLSAGLLFARYQFFEQYFLKITTGIRNFEISLATINPSLVMILQKISSLTGCFITNIIFFNIFYVVWSDLSAIFLAEMFGILCLWAIHVPGNNKSLWLKSGYTVK